MTTYENLDQKAQKLLEQSDALALPINLKKVADFLGVEVVKKELEEEFSGFLAVKEKTIVINSCHSPVRQRFTTAHEIGHYRLHRNKNPDSPVFIDRTVYFRKEGGINSRLGYQIEMEANAFAAGLLMPKSLLEDYLDDNPNLDLGETSDIKLLADEFEVSRPAMEFRLRNLGLVLPTSF